MSAADERRRAYESEVRQPVEPAPVTFMGVPLELERLDVEPPREKYQRAVREKFARMDASAGSDPLWAPPTADERRMLASLADPDDAHVERGEC